MSDLLEVKNLAKHFPARSSKYKKFSVKAVDGVSFSIAAGETFGLVGESGCGKSTLGRSVLRLVEPTSGSISFDGTNVGALSKSGLRRSRRHMQMVFQDPFTSLDPRQTVGQTLEECLRIHGMGNMTERVDASLAALARMGLAPDHYYRYPHELSGGQRQRVGLARALILKPRLMVCDEPVSALDVIVQAQIVNLLREIQAEDGLAYLFISHDIGVVRHVSDEIGVMYLGKLVEKGRTDALFAEPLHPYTQALLASTPKSHPAQTRERITLSGDLPSPYDPPTGCQFNTRCPFAMDICRAVEPPTVAVSAEQEVACHLYG